MGVSRNDHGKTMKVYNKYHDGSAPVGSINIMRPGRWGNPHPIGYCHQCGVSHSREECVAAFEAGLTEAEKSEIRRVFKDVPGVICCCAPRPCHGDVIKKIVEGL